MKIWVNTIVNNEENFLWFALMSVVDFVDKILVWDSGSTDRTVDIIKKVRDLKGDKIDFREIEEVGKEDFPKIRQEMLQQSDCDWILILDGDEIWWESSIKKLKRTLDEKGEEIDGIVVPMKVPVGDIYHFQEEAAGQYRILGRKGHLSLRAIRKKIPGLHVNWPYGKETYLDENNLPIQERKNIIFLEAPFLHVTHLKRSSLKRQYEKFKHELGRKVSRNFKFPEVLYKEYPQFISSPWIKISGIKLLKAKILTPLRKIKRKVI